MNKSPLNIVIIAGTTREGRQTIHAARFVEEVAESMDEISVTFVDVKDFFPTPGEGNDEESKDPKWGKIASDADGYVIVSPEYNRGYPGSLKMLLDNQSAKAYLNKPVALVGVSSGQFGGTRALLSLLPVVRELGMQATTRDAYFPNVQDMFDEDGKILSDSEQKTKENIQKALTELVWLGQSLRWGRENLSN